MISTLAGHRPMVGAEAFLIGRRVVVRHPYLCGSAVPWPPRYQQLGAQVLDMSPAGVTLHADRAFEPGLAVSVRFRSRALRPAGWVVAGVEVCRPHPGGGWVLECPFDVALSRAELEELR
jgi:hypothetical protein